jgi:anti-sigma B factor antagonist
MALQVDTERQDGQVRIVVRGELDMTNADRLERELYAAEAEEAGEIVLDLQGVDYFDSTGLGLLLDADVRAAAAGRRLRVVAGEGEAARVIRLVNVRERLTAAELE